MRLWPLRVALVIAGLTIMRIEGSHQPAPGVWFAVAMILIFGAAFVGRRS